MLRGYRSIVAAVGLVLAAHHPNVEAQPKQSTPQERSARALENIASRYDDQAERAERAPESNLCQPGNDQRNSDLCAQWKAADAAADSAWWAAVGGFASAISTILVLIALYFAFRSNWIARDTAKRQLRAYLTVSKIRVRRIVADKQIEVDVSFKNTGQTPAKRITLFSGVKTAGTPTNEQFFFLDLIPLHDDASVVILGAGESSFADLKADPPETSIANFAEGRWNLYVFGRIDYQDTFGSSHTTWFRSRMDQDLKSVRLCVDGNNLT